MYVQGLNPEYYLIMLWSVIGLPGGWLTVSFLKKPKHLYFTPKVQGLKVSHDQVSLNCIAKSLQVASICLFWVE